MNLKKLQYYTAEYRKFLRRNADYEGIFVWHSQKYWQDNFDINAPVFAETYDAALQNDHSKRLWKADNYLPKEIMFNFAKMQPDFVRYMFKDLFDESKEIGGRVGRFVFHCDELLKEYKAKNPRSVQNNHFHDDEFHAVSMYLAFQYPSEYALFEFFDFRKMMQLLGSLDVPEIADFTRYVKTSRTLFKLLEREEDLMAFHKKRIKNSPLKIYEDRSMLLVYDFIKVCTNERSIKHI